MPTAELPDRAASAHYGQWPLLVRAAIRGDVEAARVYARDLSVDGQDGVGAEQLGAGLGYLQVAAVEELTDGVAEVARGCAACHRHEHVMQPDVRPWRHEQGHRQIAAALAFDAIPDVGPPAVSAESAPAALAACARCHATGTLEFQ